MKVLIYGIGSVTAMIENDLQEEHEVIGYTDSISSIDIYNGKPFYSLKELEYLKFDYIIIAVRGMSCLKICNILQNDYMISKEKIVPYRLISESQIYKLKLDKCYEDEYKGIIVGSSMSLFGILPSFLSVPFLNLSVKSQDIYYNCKTILSIIDNYSQKVKKLEYIIMDMYDYNVFNYDISISSGYLDYLAWGGMLKEHNYRYNTCISGNLNEQLLISKAMLIEKSDKIIEMRDTLFKSEGIIDFWSKDRPNERWSYISEKAPGNMEKFIGGIVKKRFENTNLANRSILTKTIARIKEFNPNIKIIFTLIPRFITMETVSVPFMKAWKEEFEKEMYELCKQDNVHFFDYKGETKISGNPQYFFDVDHLNTIGAGCLTSILNEQLKQL